ncbi:MAG: 16S rRNA (cytosine(1402)-N(4))-methyltransferase, partial [Acidobacteria bacterium]|nr:16S rRNA (cytosine(1402)-N(4))-methyltransferase [Acidobacteriota bacterium]
MQIHKSVMLDRCITLLTPAIERNSNPIVVDATLGLGGHSKAILEKFPQVRIVGLDRDQSAMKIAKANLQNFAERVTIIHAIYDEIPEVLDNLGFTKVDGILFDLGVSSLQLDEAERGFS